MADFYLVQRFIRDFRHKGAVTSMEHLAPEYMGSANFEFGAMGRARQAMEKLKLSLTQVTLHAYDREVTLHVVAAASESDSLQARFQDWANRKFSSHEEPNLRYAILKLDEGRYFPYAWWSLNDNIFWSLDEGISRSWLEELNPSAGVAQESAVDEEFDLAMQNYVHQGPRADNS